MAALAVGEAALAWESRQAADTKPKFGDTGARNTTPTAQAMSEDQLKAFLEAVKADESLQERLKETGDTESIIEIAKAEGFVISAEELKRAQAVISDKDLEGIAGGIVGARSSFVFLGGKCV